MRSISKWILPILLGVALLPYFLGGALAHPGHKGSHKRFDQVQKKSRSAATSRNVRGPVTFSQVHAIKQSSSMEVWAGFRFKAYYHLTITGKRTSGHQEIKRTLTFEVANDRKKRTPKNRAHRALTVKAYARKMTRCKELAKRAMMNPSQYNFRVENHGRKSAACRLINTQKKVTAKAEIAHQSVEPHGGAV